MRWGLALGVAGLPLSEAAVLAREAEAAGIDTLAVGEASVETFAAATLLATATTRPRIMSAVATWARPAILTALAAATVDEIATGRYVLGLGTAPPAWNRDWYAIDPSRPLLRMREYVAAVRGAMRAHSGRTLDLDGQHITVRGYARMAPPYREDVPVHLGATRPGMARLAGEIADGVLVNWIHTPGWLREELLPALAAGEARSGRRVERGAMVRVHVDGNRGRALETLRRSFTPYLAVPYLHEVAARHGWDTTALPDDMIETIAIPGDVATVRERLAAYDGALDWVEIVPAGGLEARALRAAYDELIGIVAQS